VKTLVLIAGQSKRFWPLTEKTLFPLCGTNLLELTTQRLKQAGCEDIILVGGAHNLADVAQHYPAYQTIEQKDLSLGMRGALLSALPLCGDDPVLVVCANDIIDPEGYRSLLVSSLQPSVDGAMLAQRRERYFPGGYLQLEEERITAIMEKPGAGNEPSDLVNIVAHVHNAPAKLLAALKEAPAGTDDGYEQALTNLFGTLTYRAVPYERYWQAVKYPWHLLELLPHLLGNIGEQSIHSSAVIHPSAVIDGPVVLGEGVRVFPHATVRGPCYIGPHSIVANNALVRGSSIGPNCVVGYSTEVKASIFAEHVWTHSNYIGDSIIGENVSFGAGSITGNLRLDEGEISSVVQGEKVSTGLHKLGVIVGQGCRFGIHTSVNPGVKVGAGTFVNSGCVLTEDIPDGRFLSWKDGSLHSTENRASAPLPAERNVYREGIKG